jgi:hypothetical protein
MAMLSRFSRNSARLQPPEPVVSPPPNGAEAMAARREPEPPVIVASEPPAGFTEIKMRLHQRLLDEINLSAIVKLSIDEFRQQVGGLV